MGKNTEHDWEKTCDALKAMMDQGSEKIQLPENLTSSRLFEKMHQQAIPETAPKHGWNPRVLSVCASAAAMFLVAVGIMHNIPMLKNGIADDHTAAGMSSSAASPMMLKEGAAQSLPQDDYSSIVEALEKLQAYGDDVRLEMRSAKGSADTNGMDMDAPMPQAIQGPYAGSAEEETAAEETGASPEAAEDGLEKSAPAAGGVSAAAVTQPEGDPFLVGGGMMQGSLSSGSNLYVYQEGETPVVQIYDASSLALASVIETTSGTELYSYQHYLILLDPYYFYEEPSDPSGQPEAGGMTAYVYDVADNTSPVMTGCFSQSGRKLAVHLDDGILYMATNSLVTEDVAKAESSAEYIPALYNSAQNGSATVSLIPAEDIEVLPEPKDPNYIVVSSVKVADTSTSTTYAMLGRMGEDAYFTDSGIYLVDTSFDAEGQKGQTEILKVEEDAAGWSFSASQTLEGYLVEGALEPEGDSVRAVSTEFRDNGYTGRAYVLDGQMDVKGKAEFFLPGTMETISYSGDYAYVTYHDAGSGGMAAISFTDAAAPVLAEKSVDLSWMPDQMMSLAGNLLLGMRYDGDQHLLELALFSPGNGIPQIGQKLSVKADEEFYSWGFLSSAFIEEHGSLALQFRHQNGETDLYDLAVLSPTENGRFDLSAKITGLENPPFYVAQTADEIIYSAGDQLQAYPME